MKKMMMLLLITLMLLSLMACESSNRQVSTSISGLFKSSVQEDEVVDTIELVNLRGDEIPILKFKSGEYKDNAGAVYRFDGVDTWTDEKGVEWNEVVR